MTYAIVLMLFKNASNTVACSISITNWMSEQAGLNESFHEKNNLPLCFPKTRNCEIRTKDCTRTNNRI